jgi:hypothetical protein
MECDTKDGTYTEVDAADIYGGAIPGIKTGDTDRVIAVGYKGYKPFIRLDTTGTSTTGTRVSAVVLVVPRRMPA